MRELQVADTKRPELCTRAASIAREAAARAGVEIRTLVSVAEFEAASRLTAQIWDDAEPKAPASFLRALGHSGNFVAGAFHGRELAGISIAFFGREDREWHLHSHITGIAPRFQNRSLGFALKQFQRWWALDHGTDCIQWTADPLVRRNLYFNLVKLGATLVAYYPDFYGSIPDGVNGDGESDRVLMRWDLASSRVARCAGGSIVERVVDDIAVVLDADHDGKPIVSDADGDSVRLWIPENVVSMRQDDPARARAWREALREAVCASLASGYRADAMTRDGWCILSR